MKKPTQTPMDPSAPRAKQVNKIPMPRLYPQSMEDDLYSSTDKIDIETVNKKLDEIANENSENSN